MALSRLAQYERHHTQGASVSVSAKTTLALVLNTAITPVLLYANFEMGDAIPSVLALAQESTNFSSRWYATVGAGICVTMLSPFLPVTGYLCMSTF